MQIKYCSLCCREIQPYTLVISTNLYQGKFKLKQSVLLVHLKLSSIFCDTKKGYMIEFKGIGSNGLLWGFEERFSCKLLRLEISMFKVTFVAETYSCQL